MDISIAVVYLKNSVQLDLKNFCTPDKFELLILRGAMSSLPKKRIKNNHDTIGEALEGTKHLLR